MESMTKFRSEGNVMIGVRLNDLKAYVERAADRVSRRMRWKPGFGSGCCNWVVKLWGCCLPVGPGDEGETVVLPDGHEVRRLGTPHARVYQSVFGRLRWSGWSMAPRRAEDEYVPFDRQLELPESDFSYLLQDWAQSVAVETPIVGCPRRWAVSWTCIPRSIGWSG